MYPQPRSPSVTALLIELLTFGLLRNGVHLRRWTLHMLRETAGKCVMLCIISRWFRIPLYYTLNFPRAYGDDDGLSQLSTDEIQNHLRHDNRCDCGVDFSWVN